MDHKIEVSMLALALALCGSPVFAHATESAVHVIDGDGRSGLVWQNPQTGSFVCWPGGNAAMSTTVRVTHLAYNLSSDFDLRNVTIAFSLGDAFTDPARRALHGHAPRTGPDVELFPDDSRARHHAYGLWVGNADSIAVGAGEFDGNGTADVLYRHGDGSNFLIADAAHAHRAAYHPLAPVTSRAWKVTRLGDFDGDGLSDILWPNAVTGYNVIWRSGITPQPISAVRLLDWKIQAVAHFNGDGGSDIFRRNAVTGANVMWDSGMPSRSRAVRGITNQAWQVTTTGDFDGDGRLDLFWRNRSTGANVIRTSANAGTQLAVVGVRNQAWTVLEWALGANSRTIQGKIQ